MPPFKRCLLLLVAALLVAFCVISAIEASAYQIDSDSLSPGAGLYITYESEYWGATYTIALPPYSDEFAGSSVPLCAAYSEEPIAWLTCEWNDTTNYIEYSISWNEPNTTFVIWMSGTVILPDGRTYDHGQMGIKCDSSFSCESACTLSGPAYGLAPTYFFPYSQLVEHIVYHTDYTEMYNINMIPQQTDTLLQNAFYANIVADRAVSYMDIYVPAVDMDNMMDSSTLRSYWQDGWYTVYPSSDTTAVDQLFGAVDWIGRTFDGILDISIVPGVTIGGIIGAFLGVLLTIAFLKLYAGG